MSANHAMKEIFGSIPKEISLQWHNINFVINDHRSTNKIILNNVSGKTKSKNLTALMGPSGSGKTTLLECIACRTKNVQGTVTLNDTLMTNDIMPEISGFLPQINITSENFTVMEYMQFMCALKLHNVLDTFKQQNRISVLIQSCGLKKCINTEISKLSGGERKKLFLIDLLLSDPAIIYCDEPTTGLDGYSALKMVQILKELASKGKIVILSIHQPSPDIIKYFDQIIMVSQGSVIMHGNTEQISNFFTDLGIICPISYNIAEFYIKQISVIPGQELQCIENIKNLKNKFQIIHNNDENDKEVFSREVKIRKRLKCPLFTQFRWLLWRTRIDAKRELFTLLISYLVTMFVAFVMAIFYSSSQNTFNDVQNTRGYLYLSASELFFAISYAVIYTFPKELPIFLAERDLYSSFVYYIVKIISTIPEAIIYAFSFLAIVCFSVQSSMDFMLYLNMGFVMSVALCTTVAYGFFISAVFKSIDYIKILKAPLDIIFMMTGGIFLDLKTLSYGLVWFKYLSSLYYSYENLSILQFERIVSLSNPNENDTIIYNTLHEMGIYYENYYFNLYCLVLLGCVMHLISCIILMRRRKNFNSLSRA